MMLSHSGVEPIKSDAVADSLFQGIVENASDGIVVVDGDGIVVFCNRAFAQLFQRAPDELKGQLIGFPVAARESVEIDVLRKDGSMLIAEMRVSLTCFGKKQVSIAVLRDITERKHNEDRMRLSEKIFENTQEGILVTDASGVILTVNPAFSAVTGYTAEEALGRNPSLLNSGRHDQAFYQQMWQTIGEDGQWRGEIWNRRKNGEIYPEWINMSVIRDHEGTISHYVAIFSDITTAKANEERLKALAHFDSLTGLPNRFLFQDHVELALAQAARKGRQVAIMFLDIDHFKAINDSLGHRAGDTLLIEVAGRLSGCLRAGDTLGRVGGDEFSAVLPDLESPVAATIVAAKFIEALIPSFQIEGRALNVTTSIGIAVFPQHGAGLTQLSHAADAAMYQVKKQGRNAYRLWVPEYNDKPMSHSAVSIRQESGGSE
jgi:diguanylate cyclase (GGDEF)-like protein/PAS domain S-box-containing protein